LSSWTQFVASAELPRPGCPMALPVAQGYEDGVEGGLQPALQG
jgi:hypothetical protein